MRAAVLFVLLACVLATVTEAASRKDLCGSDTDCVLVTFKKSQLRIDELDFSRHSFADIFKLLPSWFGPPRGKASPAVTFVYRGQAVKDLSQNLAAAKVKLGEPLEMAVTTEHREL